MDDIAINKVCKLNFRYFVMYLAISQQHGYQGFFKGFTKILRVSFLGF